MILVVLRFVRRKCNTRSDDSFRSVVDIDASLVVGGIVWSVDLVVVYRDSGVTQDICVQSLPEW